MTRCREYQGAPTDCLHPVFDSADGSIRCRGCHLHPGGCTCGPTVRARLAYAMALAEAGTETVENMEAAEAILDGLRAGRS